VASLGAWLFFALAVGTAPAEAGRSAWVETPGGQIRLVTAAPTTDGALPAILEIRLEPGWRTYWTDPGASGIPPEVTVHGKGLGADSIRFSGMRLPVPKRFAEGDLTYIGYDRPVAFPLMIKAGPAVAPGTSLQASVFLGICRSICIPVQATLDLALSGTQNDTPLDEARIRTAFAALPQAPSDDFALIQAQFDAGAHEIVLTLRLPKGAQTPEVFLAGPSGYAFKVPEITTQGDGLTQVRIGTKLPPKLAALPAARPADGSIRATVSAEGRAIETPLVFGP
jgi:DsbC/DsbD-like thiol-disulfide interchange protein